MNRNISTTGESVPAQPIMEEELNQSLESLHRIINSNKHSNSIQMTSLIVKIAYELGYYYYLLDNLENMEFYFNFVKNNLGESKTYYFDVESVDLLVKFIKNSKMEKVQEMLNDNADMIETSTEHNLLSTTDIVQKDFAEFLTKMNIDPSEKAVIEKYSVDDTKLFELMNSEEIITYSENLIFLTFKNCK